MPKLERGRIVWVEIDDPRGHNRKRRPAVILTSDEDLRSGQPIVAIAVTTQIPEPIPEDLVELPWHRDGVAKTKLRQRCAAVCTWQVIISPSQIMELGGMAPGKQMLEILKKVDAPSGDESTPS